MEMSKISQVTFEQSKATAADQPLPLRKDSWDDLRSYKHEQLRVLKGGVNLCFLFSIPIVVASLVMAYVHDVQLSATVALALAGVGVGWGLLVFARVSYLQMRVLLWRCPRCQHRLSLGASFQDGNAAKTTCGHCGASEPQPANASPIR